MKQDKDAVIKSDKELSKKLMDNYNIPCYIYEIIRRIGEREEDEEEAVDKVIGDLDDEDKEKIKEEWRSYKIQKIGDLGGADSIQRYFLTLLWHKTSTQPEEITKESQDQYIKKTNELIALCKFKEEDHKIYFYNDEFSYIVTYYCSNSEVLCEESAEKELGKYYAKTKDDHFAAYRMADFYYARATYYQNMDSPDYEKVAKNLEKSEEYLNKAEKAYYQDGQQYSSLFVPFRELSILKYTEKDSVFVYTTFFPYFKYAFERKLGKLKHDADILQLVIIKKQLDTQRSLFKEETSNKVHELEKEFIAILSIFAAMLIFASAEVKLFQDIRSVHAAMAITLSFAGSLCLFALVIYSLLSNRHKVKIFVAVFLIIATIVAFSVWHIWKEKDVDFNGYLITTPTPQSSQIISPSPSPAR